MSGHGGFPISRHTAERVEQETTSGPDLNQSGGGWVAASLSNLFGAKFGEKIDRSRSEQDMKGFRDLPLSRYEGASVFN